MAKQKNMIRKRVGKNRTTYQVTYDLPSTGKRKRKSKTFYSYQEAVKFRDELRYNRQHGLPLGTTQEHNLTVEDCMRKWGDLHFSTLSPTTANRYKGLINEYIVPCLGNKSVSSLSWADVQEAVNQLLKASPASGKPLSVKTVKNTVQVLKLALDLAVDKGILSENPCSKVKLPKKQHQEQTCYDEEEINRCLLAAKGTDLFLPLCIECTYGLRRGELLGLKWSAVDFENKTIQISNNRVLAGSQVIEKDPKSESGKRTLDLPESLINLLKEEKKHSKSEYVLVNRKGMPWNPDAFSRKFARFLKKNNLPKTRFHGLRHSVTSTLLNHNVPVKTVQKIMGHSDAMITMNVYAHSTNKQQKEAIEVMHEVLKIDIK